jgi:hypothetical protein
MPDKTDQILQKTTDTPTTAHRLQNLITMPNKTTNILQNPAGLTQVKPPTTVPERLVLSGAMH